MNRMLQFVVATLVLAISGLAQAQTTTRVFSATWDAVTGASSYCLYRDSSPDMASRYSSRGDLDVSCTTGSDNLLSWSLPIDGNAGDLVTDYFAVTALDATTGLESLFSNEVAVVTEIPDPPPPAAPDAPTNLNVVIQVLIRTNP